MTAFERARRDLARPVPEEPLLQGPLLAGYQARHRRRVLKCRREVWAMKIGLAVFIRRAALFSSFMLLFSDPFPEDTQLTWTWIVLDSVAVGYLYGWSEVIEDWIFWLLEFFQT